MEDTAGNTGHDAGGGDSHPGGPGGLRPGLRFASTRGGYGLPSPVSSTAGDYRIGYGVASVGRFLGKYQALVSRQWVLKTHR